MAVWKVIINGKDSGIRETNHAFAAAYWAYRSRLIKTKIELKRVVEK